MSRRHHGRPHHGRHRIDPARPDEFGRQSPPFAVDADSTPAAPPVQPAVPDGPTAEVPAVEPASIDAAGFAPAPQPLGPPMAQAGLTNGHATDGESIARPTNGTSIQRDERPNGCTAPQLRRFIKSRPYVPMHELRRRFAIDGNEDDVTQVPLDEGHVYVGLPQREGSLLGELLRGGEIGYELSFDPRAPIVVGVYPMRPVPRP
jgi:hypothetical protein